jgi:hypothetical protein
MQNNTGAPSSPAGPPLSAPAVVGLFPQQEADPLPAFMPPIVLSGEAVRAAFPLGWERAYANNNTSYSL